MASALLLAPGERGAVRLSKRFEQRERVEHSRLVPRALRRRSRRSTRFSSTVSDGKMRRPSGTSAMPRATRRGAGSDGEGLARRSGSSPRIGATSPDDRLEQRRLPGAVGADDRHGLGRVDVELEAEQRLEVAVAGVERLDLEQASRSVAHGTASPFGELMAQPHRHRTRRRGRRRAPRREAITSWGSPSISLRPASTAIMRSTTRSSAWTMCSIQTIATPVARRSRIVATSSSTSASVRPPAISSSSSTLGLRRQRPGQLEALAVEQGQRARDDVGLVDACPVVSSASTAASSAVPSRRVRRAERRPDEHVLEHREPLERPRDLRGAPDPATTPGMGGLPGDVGAVEADRAPVGSQVAGDEVEQRRLARAVRPDDAEGLTLGNVEREVLDDADAAEALGDADDFEQGRHRRVRLRPAACSSPVERDLRRQLVVGHDEIELELAHRWSSATGRRRARSGDVLRHATGAVLQRARRWWRGRLPPPHRRRPACRCCPRGRGRRSTPRTRRARSRRTASTACPSTARTGRTAPSRSHPSASS